MKTFVLAALLFFVGIAQAQLNGTYYIGNSGTRPGGGDPDYLSLKAATDALNSNGISGNVTMYFTSDLVEPSTVQLGVNTGGNSITFKPYSTVSSVTITFVKNVNLAGNGWYGMWVIGSKDTTGAGALTSTNNIVIDGSRTVGGTTRDLTLITTGTVTGAYPIRIAGQCDNVVIKNCSIINSGYTSTSSSYAVRISSKATASAADSVCTNITIQNNYIQNIGGNSGHGILIDGVSTQTVFSSGINIRDNLIIARTRGIMLNYAGSTNIFNNTIRVKQTANGLLSYGVFGYIVGGGLTSTINIYNNVIDTLLTSQTTLSGSFGIAGIYCSSVAVWNIYNNMITGILTTNTADPNLTNLFGIYAGAGTVNASYNTILMNQLAYSPTGNTRPQKYAGLYVAGATVTAKNNIICSNQTGDSSYTVYVASGSLTSDFNNLVPNAAGFVGFNSSASRTTLADWKTGSGQDANSKSVAVTFTSATDLHLSGGSNGDHNLTGTPLGTVTTDIDGAVRNGTYPYMGADEGSVALPVELTNFTANVHGSSVLLSWKTATETNNHGFEVERLTNGSWTKVGFVEGAGTSASPKSYQFIDAQAEGRVSYRLKQVDRDGGFTYSSIVEVAAMAPAGYELTQNYPNPFNPSTMIRFAVKETEHASLKVYDVTGREVAELFNGLAESGKYYELSFNASHLSSGMYIYVLATPSHREVKKMQLLK